MSEDFLKKLDEEFKTKFLKKLETIVVESDVPDRKGFKGKLLRTLSAWVAYKFGCDEGHSCQRELKVIIETVAQEFPWFKVKRYVDSGDDEEGFEKVKQWFKEYFDEEDD